MIFERKKIPFETFSKENCNKLLEDSENFNNPSVDLCHSLIHCAAMNNNKNLSYDDYYKVNVELSIALFKHAAKKNKKIYFFLAPLIVKKQTINLIITQKLN